MKATVLGKVKGIASVAAMVAIMVLVLATVVAAVFAAAAGLIVLAEEIGETEEVTYAEAFPDEVFRDYILGILIKDGRTAEDFISEADGKILAERKTLMLESRGWIFSLKRLEYFTNLNSLYCGKNYIGELDLSGNAALTTLRCSDNLLTELDVSGNPLLKILECVHNELTELDISQNTMLEELECWGNLMSGDPDVSVRGWRDYWEAVYDYENGVSSDFRYFPQNSKKTYFNVFPDRAFRGYVLENVFADGRHENDRFSKSDILIMEAVEEMDISGLGIADLTGLGYFGNLKRLDCSGNKLTGFFYDLYYLEFLDCSDNMLEQISTNCYVHLKELYCQNNRLEYLQLPSCLPDCEFCGEKLEYLYCYNNLMGDDPDISVTGYDYELDVVIPGWMRNWDHAGDLADLDDPETASGFIYYPQGIYTEETPEPTLEPAPAAIYGDVDGDGEIDGEDLVCLKRYVEEWEEYIGDPTREGYKGPGYRAESKDFNIIRYIDVNGEGIFNMADLICLKRHLVEPWPEYKDPDREDYIGPGSGKGGEYVDSDITILIDNIQAAAGEEVSSVVRILNAGGENGAEAWFKVDTTLLNKAKKSYTYCAFYYEDGEVLGYIPFTINGYLEEKEEFAVEFEISVEGNNIARKTVTGYIIPRIWGDIDGNEVVDGEDLLAMKRFTLDWDDYIGDPYREGYKGPKDMNHTDVDGNGVVDGMDYICLKRFVLDWEEYTDAAREGYKGPGWAVQRRMMKDERYK